MNIIKLKLSYTRDTTLIIQQLWFKAQVKGIKQLGINNPYKEIGVDYISDGAIEIWENKDAIEYTKKALVNLCSTENDMITEFITGYERALSKLNDYWKKEVTEDIDELVKFINFVDEQMLGDLVMTYLGENENTPEPIRTRTKKLRSEDHFFAYNDLFIRKSLQKIYPTHKDHVTFFKIEEINNPPSLEILKRREHSFVWTLDYESIESLEKFQKKHTYIQYTNINYQETTLLKGNIAQPGMVTGIVKILRKQSEMEKIKENNIIVSPMTTPALLAAIKKCSAIVTDEGGMLCHAAIISRELKKPCIIGTKIATKVFKEGDLVEVDANNGIVRKIE